MMGQKRTFEEVVAENRELRDRLRKISQMAEAKIPYLKGDHADLMAAASELLDIKAMAEGKIAHPDLGFFKEPGSTAKPVDE